MRTVWLVIYNIIGIPILWLFFRLYSLFNSKIKEGFRGRRNLFDELDKALPRLKNGKVILIHSSSLGEFQQAMPLVEVLSKKNYDIVLSFFSPSGFLNAKISQENVVKTYIPFDSISNQKKFLNKVNPELLIFMRYDLWFNILYLACKKNIRTVLANARYDEADITWKLPVVNSFKKSLYGMIETAFVIDDYDEKNYNIKLKNEKTKIVKAGDSKFERVYHSVNKINKVDILPGKITDGKKIFLMGSSWKDDEDVLLPAVNKAIEYEPELLTILVPHEPKETKILAIEKVIKENYFNLKPIRYSALRDYNNQNFIILDKIGILSKLYSAAYLSYVGGGFRTGLHNILEPAIFNMPVLFSDKVTNSDEDEMLVKAGCGIVVENTKQFYKIFRTLLKDERYRNETGMKCELVFRDTIGVADNIVKQLGL